MIMYNYIEGIIYIYIYIYISLVFNILVTGNRCTAILANSGS